MSVLKKIKILTILLGYHFKIKIRSFTNRKYQREAIQICFCLSFIAVFVNKLATGAFPDNRTDVLCPIVLDHVLKYCALVF